MLRYALPAWSFLLLALPQAACSHAAPLQGPQLIVKFKAGSLACDEAGVKKLAQQSGQALQLVRPMSGDACLLGVPSPAAVPAAVEALQKHPSVEWAEADEVMRANPR